MLPSLTKLLQNSDLPIESIVFYPTLFRMNNIADAKMLEALLTSDSSIKIYDTLFIQLSDLVKLENPSIKLNESQLKELILQKLNGIDEVMYGVWVFYPWRKVLVHLLDEDDFVRVRTVRNLYKITTDEQHFLKKKKVGIIGLSVGQSVAIAIAMERIAGEIRIADFDLLELSNLNRIRAGVQNLGLPKTAIVAREISEIDPFLKVTIYKEGITTKNINDFLTLGGQLDLLVDEGDDIRIKVAARIEARSLGIPVIMDTSDLFLLDIERFDLDKERKILHGLLDESLDYESLTPADLRSLTLKVFDVEGVSSRGQQSLLELGKTITSWPQLATDVMAGGAVAAKFIKQILLNEKIESGRSRLDIIEAHNANSTYKKIKLPI